MTDLSTFDPGVLTELAALQTLTSGLLGIAAIRGVVRTGVLDAVGPKGATVEDLARTAGVDQLALRRVLRYLETHGLVQLKGDRVRPTERTRHYQRDSPLQPTLAHRGTFDVAHALEHALRTGGSAWEHLHGEPFFDWLTAHPDEEELFADSMRNEGTVLNLIAVPIIDLSDVATVADIAGGTGDLLTALVDANPTLRGILVDLPTVLAKAPVHDRIEHHAVDLFGEMPHADAYVLARVLHDWDDESARTILRGIRRAAAPGARLFDLDLVVPAGDEPHASKTSDIGMLLLFGGGRERTESELRTLFADAGWRLDDVTTLPLSSLLRATAV